MASSHDTDGLNFEGYEDSSVSAFLWPDNPVALEQELSTFRKMRIQVAALRLRKRQPVGDPFANEITAGLLGLKLVNMTSDLKKKTQIDKGLQIVAKSPVREEHKALAAYLLQKWAAEDEERALLQAATQTLDEPDAEESPDESIPPATRTARTRTSAHPKATRDRGTVLKKPPPDHPIYGRGGIMYGLLVDKSSGKRLYVMDPSYTPRPAKVYGHNGFTVRDWFPQQRVANLRGIHAPPMASIDIGPSGAYSVVVKGGSVYEDLDQDLGDMLYYSGSGSHDNLGTEPRETGGTNALRLSIETGNPVRVLRAGGANGKAPKPVCGIRYDGL